MSILVLKLLIGINSKLQFSCYDFSDEYLKIIHKYIFRFILFLSLTIKIAYQFADHLSGLKSILQMLDKAFKSLLVLHDHPHVKFNLVMGMLSCKIFYQLHGLSFH